MNQTLKTALIAGGLAFLAFAFAIFTVRPGFASDAPKWTGCGVTASVGMAVTKTEASAEVAGFGSILNLDGLGTSGAQAGLGVGCDLQLDRLVIGAFADWVKHDQAFNLSSPLLGGQIATLSFDDQWTVGGRAGLLIQPNVLVYGLIGYTGVRTSDLSGPLFSVAVPDLKGITVGGGIETALGSGFFLGAEYRYTQLDAETLALAPGFLDLKLDPEVHQVSARVSYKLGFDGK